MNMNKYNLIWGIVCLVIAAGLTVANLTLPSSSVVFQIGGINMPWLPPIVLAIIAIILLSSKGEEKMNEEPKPQSNVDTQKAALNKRMETIAWGCFLIMLGGFMFVPRTQVPEGLWSVGVGLIMIGLNIARYLNHIRMSGFTTVLGIIAVLGGMVQLFGVKNLEGAFLLIILGAYLILKPWFDQHKLFGKAEQG